MKEKIKKLVDAALLYHTEKDGLSKTIEERAVRLGCIAKETSSLKEDVCNEEFREFWDNVSLSQPNGVSFRGIPEYVT